MRADGMAFAAGGLGGGVEGEEEEEAGGALRRIEALVFVFVSGVLAAVAASMTLRTFWSCFKRRKRFRLRYAVHCLSRSHPTVLLVLLPALTSC